MALVTRLPKALASSASAPSKSTAGRACMEIWCRPAESASAAARSRSSSGFTRSRFAAGGRADSRAGIGAWIEAELHRGSVVAPLDAVLGIQDDDAVGQGLRGAAKAGERVAELALATHRGPLIAMQGGQHFVPAAASFGHLPGHGLL